jgi:tRNA pseudouridine55 synthase
MFIQKSTKISKEQLQEVAAIEGAFVLIDKEKNWTSFDVVAKVRNNSKVKKVGHGGTLDPLATGLLIIGLGKGTKKLDELAASYKEYEAVIKLGATTASFDAETEEENIQPIENITNNKINEVISSFLGEQEQTPPIFSAKSVNGVRSYKLARMNMPVELKKSNIDIRQISVEEINLPYITIKTNCSKGTYIRSLANDIGAKLGCGGYLADLRRTKVNEVSVEDAITISEFIEIINN